MKSDIQGILLDESYSKAFLLAAHEQGLITIKEEKKLSSYLGMPIEDLLFDSRLTKRLRKKALETAAIFEKVHLFGMPSDINLDKIISYDNQLIGARIRKSESWMQLIVGKEKYVVPSSFVQASKKISLSSTLRKQNYIFQKINLEPVTKACVSTTYDVIASLCDTGVSLPVYIKELEKTLNNPKILLGSELEYKEAIVDALKKIERIYPNQPIPANLALLTIIQVSTQILSSFELMLFSIGFSAPFLTNDFLLRSYPLESAPPSTYETFSLCRIALHEEIGYAPDVDSIEDVLRLRNNKYIVQFREQLLQWCELLPEGNETALRKIKHDIQVANKDLQKLEKWRKVDNWFFWTQIPTSLIPVVSSVATVAGFATHLWIELQEKQYGWMGVTR